MPASCVTLTTRLKRAVLSPSSSPQSTRPLAPSRPSFASNLSQSSPLSAPRRPARSPPQSPTPGKGASDFASTSALVLDAPAPVPVPAACPSAVEEQVSGEAELVPRLRNKVELDATGSLARSRRRKTAVRELGIDGQGLHDWQSQGELVECGECDSGRC